MKMQLTKTNNGLPAFWENGGGMTTTGSASVIGGNHGQKKTAVFINNHGNLACKNHALFVVHKGDTIVGVSRANNTSTIRVMVVRDIGSDTTTAWAELEQTHKYEDFEWDRLPSPELDEIIEAAMNKACCYHCREMHYGKVGRTNSTEE